MKVVFDTNVFISALLWDGPPNELLQLLEEGTLTICTTPDLLEELKNVLSRPSFLPRIRKRKTSREELLSGILDLAELHPDKKIEPVVKDDPDDDKLLSCALTSGAKYIITGDSHLLELENWSNISILSPRQFLDRIKFT